MAVFSLRKVRYAVNVLNTNIIVNVLLFIHKTDFGEEMYCAIIIVRGGTMFVSHPNERKCKHIFDIYLQKELSADKIKSPRTKKSLAAQ